MHSAAWTEQLKRLPAEVHQQLVLTTANGTEFAIQTILQMDGECLVIKGRVSGCQDAGRVFFVPFDHIDFIGFNRVVAEEEFRSWFGSTEAAPAAPSAAETNGAPVRSAIPNRAALLEKIRARTAAPSS